MKPVRSLPANFLAVALALALVPAARADMLYSDPFDLVLSSVNVSGNLAAEAGRDLSTTGSNFATGHGSLTSGRDTALGDLTVANNLSVSAGRNLAITGPLVSGAATSLTVANQLQIGGSVTTGTALMASTAGSATVSGAAISSGTSAVISTGTTLAFSGAATTGQGFNASAGSSASFSNAALASGTGTTLSAATDLAFSGKVTATQAFNAFAGNNLSVAGTIKTGAGADLTAVNGLTLGTATFQGVLSATGGSTVAVNGPVSVTGNAAIQAGNSLAIGAKLGVGNTLSLTAPLSLQTADTVQAKRLAATTNLLQFAIGTPSTYGAFHITNDAVFADLDAIVVSFANGFSFVDGQVFDLILAGSLSGVEESLFSIENLNPLFGYSLAVDADSVRLSLFAQKNHGVPEPGVLTLLLAALAAAGWQRRRHAG